MVVKNRVFFLSFFFCGLECVGDCVVCAPVSPYFVLIIDNYLYSIPESIGNIFPAHAEDLFGG
jgi:hypothetical protein